LQELQALVSRKQYIESIKDQNLDKSYDMRFRGTPVEDLCLDFTLPGYPEYVLKAGDENVSRDILDFVLIYFFVSLFLFLVFD